MQIGPGKKFLYSVIVFAVAMLSLEVVLSAVYFHVNGNSFATSSAIKEALRTASGENRQGLDRWVDMPSEVLEELNSIGGVIDNANNPTGASRENSPVTEASEDFVFKLRPDLRIANYTLRAKDRPNLSPPVLQYSNRIQAPAALQDWLKENASLYHEFTTDSQGRRRTLPEVEAARKIVLVGDSVAFGLGVADRHTVASALQEQVAENQQVVNLGVPSYGPGRAYKAATDPDYAGRNHLLIYIACQNDFHGKTADGLKIFDAQRMQAWVKKFQKLEDDGIYRQVIVVMETYLQYSFQNFFDEWEPQRIASIRQGLAAFDSLTAAQGIDAVNWDSLVRDYNVEQESLYAGLALYVDHVHLSPLGNRLLADAILEKLREPGIASAVAK